MRSVVCVVAVAMILIGCGGGKKSGNVPSTSTSKTLVSFSIQSPAAAGIVDEPTKSVSVSVPSGTDVKALVAVFSTTRAKTLVGGDEQKSGVTGNDFTNPVTYTVEAQDGSASAYTVRVKTALISDKDITSFAINGKSASIVGTSIGLTLPSGTSLAALKASFTTTGSKVSVGGVDQISDVTENNFSTSLVYRVTAADATYRDYTVTVIAAQASSKEITLFYINSVKADIQGTDITLTLPFGTDRTALVAAFSTTGASVTVNGVEQESGRTPNTFTGSVVYKVTAQDGSYQNYTVAVSLSSSSAKELTAFSIDGVSAEFSGANLSLTLPYGTVKTGLVAAFSATGASVSVGGVTQISGSTPNDFTGPVIYRVWAADTTYQDYTVTVSVALAASRDITAFSVAGQAGIITGTDITVLVRNSTASG